MLSLIFKLFNIIQEMSVLSAIQAECKAWHVYLHILVLLVRIINTVYEGLLFMSKISISFHKFILY